MEYVTHVAILICVYSTLAVSLDLLVGHTGQISLAHAAFYGIGAYVAALAALRLGWPMWGGALAALGVAACLSLAISLASIRVIDDYFVIATFCFQMIFLNVVDSSTALTRGPLGLAGIPQFSVFGWQASTQTDYLILGLVMALAGYTLARRLVSTPFGLVLHAIREDDILVRSLGRNDFYFKAWTFALSSGLAAIAGTFYASYVSYVDPGNFTIVESILVLAMVIIGGAASSFGPVIGATALVLLPELLRAIGLPDAAAAELRQIIYGVLLAAIVFIGGFRRAHLPVRDGR